MRTYLLKLFHICLFPHRVGFLVQRMYLKSWISVQSSSLSSFPQSNISVAFIFAKTVQLLSKHLSITLILSLFKTIFSLEFLCFKKWSICDKPSFSHNQKIIWSQICLQICPSNLCYILLHSFKNCNFKICLKNSKTSHILSNFSYSLRPQRPFATNCW